MHAIQGRRCDCLAGVGEVSRAERKSRVAGGRINEARGSTIAEVRPLNNAVTGHPAPTTFLSREAQHATILRLLATRPHTSYELRRAGCYQCPTRVLELRRAGHAIDTTRVTVVDQDGFEHPRVALYSLSGRP